MDAKLKIRAAGQHGLFTRRQALALGFSKTHVDGWVRRGICDALGGGVYGVPGCPWTWRRKLMLATLDVGAGAVVSHWAAAALHGFPGFRPGAPELSVLKGSHTGSRWKVHTTRDLPASDRTRIDGIPVSSALRTLFDLAGVLPGQHLERLVDELLAAGTVKLGFVARRFGQYRRPGRKGVAALASILEARGPGYVPPASELEALLRDVLDRGGHPQPDWQRPHPGGAAAGRVDVIFEPCKLIVEVDGRRWHSQVEQMEADRHREIAATLAGYHTMRFMWGDLVMRADWVNQVVGQKRKLWAQ
jgi:hypothetical protein